MNINAIINARKYVEEAQAKLHKMNNPCSDRLLEISESWHALTKIINDHNAKETGIAETGCHDHYAHNLNQTGYVKITSIGSACYVEECNLITPKKITLLKHVPIAKAKELFDKRVKRFNLIATS